MYRKRLQHLIMAGWKPMKPMLVVNWCGHGEQFIPWPEGEGYWTLVPVWDHAAQLAECGSKRGSSR